MINYKRVIKLISAISVASMVFVGCTGKDVEPVKMPTAEEAINKFNEYNIEDNTTEMAKLYSDIYVDSTGFERSRIESILKSNRKDVDVTKSEVIKIEEVDENTKKATIAITANINNEEKTEEYIYAILKEGDGWAVSPDGIINCENFDVAQYNKGELNLRLAKKISLFEGAIIRINVYNDSKTQYTFGTEENKCEVIVETTDGTFTTAMAEPAKVDKKLNSYFMARKDTLTGDIQKVTVTNIYELDKDGNVLNDTKQDVVVYQK